MVTFNKLKTTFSDPFSTFCSLKNMKNNKNGKVRWYRTDWLV